MDSHSIENTSQKLRLYTDVPPIFSVFKSNIDSILIIGAGSQSITSNFSEYYPHSKTRTIEIDPMVAQVAEKYFPKKEIIHNETVISDGRIYLTKSSDSYDVIFSDAYNSFISIPQHLSTKEFNQVVKNRLSKGGIYAINFISSLSGENSLFFSKHVQDIFFSVSKNLYLPLWSSARRYTKYPFDWTKF